MSQAVVERELSQASDESVSRVSVELLQGRESTDSAPVIMMSAKDIGAHAILRFCAGTVMEQVRAVMPVCVFLGIFQRFVLGQEIKDLSYISFSLALAIVGLALFTFGLLYGLMPMGERLGQRLPHALSIPMLLVVACVLGIAVTLAEPALSVVKTAASLIKQYQAPYLFYLLNGGQEGLVMAVAVGVGISASLGMLRIHKGWGIKRPVILLVSITILFSVYVSYFTRRGDVLGLSWDLGAVTTGPVTVPLVIALGVGIAGGGHNASPLTGFGVVTLASLIPINTVLLLTLCVAEQTEQTVKEGKVAKTSEGMEWTEETPYLEIIAGFRALVPLVGLMYFLLLKVLRDAGPFMAQLEINARHVSIPVSRSLVLAQIGIIIFNIGLTCGLSKLGTAVGAVMPSAFTKMDDVPGSPIYGETFGLFVAILFAWVLGFGATLAEPALATLAITVEKLSKGRLSKTQVVLSVALGVGTGTALGLCKIVMQLPLLPMLIFGYIVAVILTIPAGEVLVNVAWDSAGVTTGPVTVPLVISLGLGLGRALNAADGFGILSLASVCPIVSVLAVGLICDRKRSDDKNEFELISQGSVMRSRSIDSFPDDDV